MFDMGPLFDIYGGREGAAVSRRLSAAEHGVEAMRRG
jgi:hypothetical protein